MKKVNWNKYKFHCSSLPTLMTQPKTKAEKESGALSATTKSALREIWIKEVYGKEKVDTKNKYCDKGLQVEQDSLDIVTRILKKGFLAKNKKQFSNDYVTGTPDVTNPMLIDIKSSWDIWTFNSVDTSKAFKDYYWQLFGYMWMLKQKKSKLIYALVDTPPEIMADELYRLSFKLSDEMVDAAKINYTFGDIPEKKRVKVFNMLLDKAELENVTATLDAARVYLKSIKL